MSKFSDDELEALLGEEASDATRAEMVAVGGASGSEFHVLSQEEARWFTSTQERYMSEYSFENIADLQDLDRLLGLELLSYRYASWLIRGIDYDGSMFDEKAVRDHKQKIDQEIRLLKQHMGMNRKNRVESEQESVSDYIKNLLRRANEMGIHRDHQIAKAIDLMMEIKKLVGLYGRTDEEERRHLGVEMDQIFTWIRDTAIPEFDSIDDAFRANQRLWIKEVS